MFTEDYIFQMTKIVCSADFEWMNVQHGVFCQSLGRKTCKHINLIAVPVIVVCISYVWNRCKLLTHRWLLLFGWGKGIGEIKECLFTTLFEMTEEKIIHLSSFSSFRLITVLMKMITDNKKNIFESYLPFGKNEQKISFQISGSTMVNLKAVWHCKLL